mmetsp:Transcript_23924/g.61636  ORF Transcript_23924/g.61636 Transcript_23924/m.61636 type:complete len:218 (+) Transcript_23924:217-870(+)
MRVSRSMSTTSLRLTRRCSASERCAATPHAIATTESAIDTLALVAPRCTERMRPSSSTYVLPWWSPVAAIFAFRCAATSRTQPLVYAGGGGRSEAQPCTISGARTPMRTLGACMSMSFSPCPGMKASSLPRSPTRLTSNWLAEASAKRDISREARTPLSKSISTYAWSRMSGVRCSSPYRSSRWLMAWPPVAYTPSGIERCAARAEPSPLCGCCAVR